MEQQVTIFEVDYYYYGRGTTEAIPPNTNRLAVTYIMMGALDNSTVNNDLALKQRGLSFAIKFSIVVLMV